MEKKEVVDSYGKKFEGKYAKYGGAEFYVENNKTLHLKRNCSEVKDITEKLKD